MMKETKLQLDFSVAIIVIILISILLSLLWGIPVSFSSIKHLGKIIIINFGLLTLLASGSFGLGSLVLSVIKYHDRQQPEYYVFIIAAGLGIIGHIFLILGAFHLYSSLAAWIVLGLANALTAIDIIRNRHTYFQVIQSIKIKTEVHLFSILLTVLLLVNFIYPLLASAYLPPLSRDEVSYHLAIPKTYIQNHSIVYISYIPYSNWPLEIEMLYTLSLLLGSETLTHLISWFTLSLICLTMVIFGKKYKNLQVGLLAACLFSTTPMVTSLAGEALVELPLTLYTLLATVLMLEWLESKQSTRWILSAVFSGLVASTKLNGAMTPLILGIVMLLVSWLHDREKFSKSIFRFAAYGLLAFMIVLPWYIKSWILTGNPIWPFLLTIFGGKNWDVLGSEYLFGFIQRPNFPYTLWNWLLGLWRLSFKPFLFGPYRITLGWHYIALLSALALAFSIYIIRKAKGVNNNIESSDLRKLVNPQPIKTTGWLGLISLLFYITWFFQTQQTRFFMPTASILALFISLGIYWFYEFLKGKWGWGIQILLFILLLSGNWLLNSADRTDIRSHIPFLLGQISRDRYLTQHAPGYQTFIYANNTLPKNAYVWLALYEVRGYYLDRNYMWANPISQRDLKLEQYIDSSQLSEELHKRGFAYILFRSTNLDNYIYIRYGPEITRLTLDLLKEHALLIYHTSEVDLYELLP